MEVEGSALEDAVSEAVNSTADLIDAAESTLEPLIASLTSAANPIPEVAALLATLNQIFAKHRDDSATFRVVLFGRTSTGKSSIIEALTGGDGRSISTGVSDFTTESRSVDWGPLQLIDTPGIGGWGRTQSVESLEQTAAETVARADLVILAFDTGSQQASEFETIGRQVARYGRPCIAVLNVRNQYWRSSCLSLEGQIQMNRKVSTQARFIGKSLQNLGLPRVPVLSVNSQKASEALCADDYAGPRAEGVLKRRDRLGIGALRSESNVDQLIHALVEILTKGAPPLRAQSLRGEIHGLFAITESDLSGRDAALSGAIGEARQVISSISNVIGLGEGSDATGVPGAWSRLAMPGSADLEALIADEQIVDGDRVSTGTIGALLEDLLRINIWPAERRLRDKCDELALSALANRKSLTADDLKESIDLEIEQLHSAASTTVDELADEIAAQLKGLKYALEYQKLAWTPGAFDIGGRTKSRDHTFWASTEAGLAAIAAIAVVLGGPVAWGVAASAAILGFFASRNRTKSANRMEERKATARSKAIKKVRTFVEDLCDLVQGEVVRQVTELTQQVADEVLSPVVCKLAADHHASQVVNRVLPLLVPPNEFDSTAGFDAIARAMSAVGKFTKNSSPVQSAAVQLDFDGLEAVRADLRQRAEVARAGWSTAPEAIADPIIRSMHLAVISEDHRLGRQHAQKVRQVLLDRAQVSCLRVVKNLHRYDGMVWLLEPNPGLTLANLMSNILEQDPAIARLVLARSLFVIGRLEELGPDPSYEGHELVRTMDRKAREVCDLFGTQNIALNDAAVNFAWSDSASVFDDEGKEHDLRSRYHLATPFDDETAQLLIGIRNQHARVNAADARVLRAERRVVDLTSALDSIDAAQAVQTAAIADWKRLVADSESRLRRSVGDLVDTFAIDVVEASAKEILKRRLECLNKWPDTPEVRKIVESWESEFTLAVEGLSEKTSQDIRNALSQSTLASRRIGGISQRNVKDQAKLVSIISGIGKGAGKRDVFYKIVKVASKGKFKFRPWGAVKGARAVGKMSVALAAIAAALTAIDLVLSKKNRGKREKLQTKVLAAARESVREALDEYLRGGNGADDLRGPLAEAEATVKLMVDDVEMLESERVLMRSRLAKAEHRVRLNREERDKIRMRTSE